MGGRVRYQTCIGCKEAHEIRGANVKKMEMLKKYICQHDQRTRILIYRDEAENWMDLESDGYVCSKFKAEVYTVFKRHAQKCSVVACICRTVARKKSAISIPSVVPVSGSEHAPETNSILEHPQSLTVDEPRILHDSDQNSESNSQAIISEETAIEVDSEERVLLENDSQQSFQSDTTTDSLNDSQSSSSSSSNTIILEVPSKKAHYENIISVPYSEKRCVVCNSASGRYAVPLSARRELYLQDEIYVRRGSRACQEHVSEGIFLPEVKRTLINKSSKGLYIDHKEIEQWLIWITQELKAQLSRTSHLNFDDPSTPEKTYKALVGFSKEQFEEILHYLDGKILPSANRTPRTALAVFLIKLRLGVSQNVIANLLGLKDQSLVSQIIHRVGEVLYETLVPEHLGYESMTREEILLKHNPGHVRTMLGVEEGKVALILDGTYLYIQHSSDFAFQSDTYSAHKHRNLVKYMMVVTPNGRIVNVHGPFKSNGTNNDAYILKAMLSNTFEEEQNKNNKLGFKGFIQENDYLVLDRGFRDCKKELEDHKVKFVMPEFIRDAEKVLSTEAANASRKVTFIRWPVEAANGQMKNRFHFLDNVIPNLYLSQIDVFVRVSCALVNKFGKPLLTEGPQHQMIAEMVEERLHLRNLLKEKVENPDGRIALTKPQWVRGDSDTVLDFPKLREDEIRLLTMGPYQIQQGKRYNIQHLDGSPLYEYYVHKHSDALIQVQLRSRFRRSLSHSVFVEFSKESTLDPVKRILSWFCRCECGSRNLGCCSHVAAVLLFFGKNVHGNSDSIPHSSTWKLLDSLDYDVRKEKQIRKKSAGRVDDDKENSQDFEFAVPAPIKRGKQSAPNLDGPYLS